MVRQDLDLVPREEVETVVHEIMLLEEAISSDVCFTRDPNDAAMLLCLGMKLSKIKYCKQMVYGKRYPQRVVFFGFSGHDEVFRFVVKTKLNTQSSASYKNVNVGELRMYQEKIKTILHSTMLILFAILIPVSLSFSLYS